MREFPKTPLSPFENEDPSSWPPFCAWEKYPTMTIYEIRTLSLGMHPILVQPNNEYWTVHQQSVWVDRGTELIRAVLAGRIKKADTHERHEINLETYILTEDALNFFNGDFETTLKEVTFPLKKVITKTKSKKDNRRTAQSEAFYNLAKYIFKNFQKDWTAFKEMLGEHSKDLPFEGYGSCTNIYLKGEQMHFSLLDENGNITKTDISYSSLKRYFTSAK